MQYEAQPTVPVAQPTTTRQRSAGTWALWLIRLVGYFVYVYLVIVEIVLTVGFFLLLFGANPTAGFTEWIYRSMERAMEPFRGIFAPVDLGITGNDVHAVLDTSVLFAMLIYGILAAVLHSLLAWLTYRLRLIEARDRALAAGAAATPVAAQTPVPPEPPRP